MTFHAYSVGIVCASVCTTLSVDEATEQLNREHPTGLDHGWQVSDDPTFASGQPNPTPCERGGEAMHYLFNC